MTRKEMDEIIEATTEIANNMRSVYKIDCVIEKFEDCELKEGMNFNTEICVWQDGDFFAKDKFTLSSFLSSDDQTPLRKIIIAMLKEKREEYISDFQKATESLEKLTKEALNE